MTAITINRLTHKMFGSAGVLPAYHRPACCCLIYYRPCRKLPSVGRPIAYCLHTYPPAAASITIINRPTHGSGPSADTLATCHLCQLAMTSLPFPRPTRTWCAFGLSVKCIWISFGWQLTCYPQMVNLESVPDHLILQRYHMGQAILLPQLSMCQWITTSHWIIWPPMHDPVLLWAHFYFLIVY